MTLQPSSKRVVYLDLLKVIAIFLVLANHCIDNVNPAERAEPWYNLWGSFYNTFSRPCVPLFMMVTGILLLPIRMSMGQFYRKRITRVLIPFVIWSVLYNLFPWVTGLLGCEPESIHLFFKWADTSQAWSDALTNILMIPVNFSPFAIQMWYVYVLIGIYLYLPIFSAWVERSTKQEQRWVLALWFVSMFVPYLRVYLTPNLFGTCSWNEFGVFYYLSGFSGYLLLGHHLVKYPLQLSRSKKYILAVLTFVVGYIVSFIGFKTVSGVPGQTDEMVELFFTFCSPNVALMTFAIFIACQGITFGSKVSKAITTLLVCTFGIWMCHYFLVGPVFLLIDPLPIHVLLKVLIENFLVLFISFVFVYAVRSTGKVGQRIMG